MTAPGKVCIVGAGPGDPELITVRGLTRLRRADAVFYDRLVPAELLAEAPTHARRIYVGKEPDTPSVAQEEITAMLITWARDGLDVVRLKGGDPFVFGRGGEEALALAEAGVPFEVVPGVTSAVAVPAAAGIPVSHRDHGATIAIAAAHRAGDTSLPWSSLAGIDTLVLLMGAARVADVCRNLLAAGKDPDTPAAAVQWGTTPHQRELHATLADLPARFAEAGITSPAVIVVGGVAALASLIGSWAPAHVGVPEDAG